MISFFVFLLSLYQLNTVAFSESVDTPSFASNPFSSDDFDANSQPELPPDIIEYPSVKTVNDETQIDFDEPITSVNIDYLNNAIMVQLKKERQKQRQQALGKNFMRFGRADKNLMRFGKRQIEAMPEQLALNSFKPGTRFERSNGAEGIRDSRGDNFMRFGRSVDGSKNLMRFGRAPSDFMRFGRAPSDFMRFGRAPSDFMRFGRAPSDFMRFGRAPSNFMRFGRAPSDFMRFGRAPSDFMRFGRDPSDFMRFGRSPASGKNLMRFGRSSNLMRFGRADKNFMRFGKSEIDKNFMRFGRPDSFMRFGRAPTTEPNNSFMRFGKRQKENKADSTTGQSPTEKDSKAPVAAETSTTSPYQDLDNDIDPVDMMFLNDLTDSMVSDEN